MFFINADGGALLDYEEQRKALGTMSRSNEKFMKKFFSLDKNKRMIFDRLNCQFAIHYFFANDTTWNNFVENIKMYLKPGGFMLITTFDGQRIMDLLSGKNQYTAYYTNQKGEKKVLFEIVKKYDIKDERQVAGTGYAIDIHNALISQEGIYLTEFLVDRRFLEKEFLEKCDMELIETDLFENQFNIHKNYFENTIKYEENPKTRRFLQNAAEYYDQENEVNKACFEMTRLNRYYIFRRKDKNSEKNNKKIQKGGFMEYSMNEAFEYINPEKFIKRELDDNDNYSFHRAVHNILQNENIIPRSIDAITFYNELKYKLIDDKDVDKNVIQKLSKELVIGHDISESQNELTQQEVALNGLNIMILENDCNGMDITAVGRRGKLSRKDPSIVLYYDGNYYHPIYRVKDDKSIGMFDTKTKFIRNIISNSDNELLPTKKV